MRSLLSTRYSAGAFNTGLLLFRVAIGLLMVKHGYDKMVHFNEYASHFMSFLGMGAKVSLALTIFAEFFCSILLILGLFTRFACIPLIIVMSVALFMVHNGNPYDDHGQMAALFLISYILILIIGPGKASVDGMIGK